MDREQAHILQRSVYQEDTYMYDAEEIINLIYDEFESRTCENCFLYDKKENLCINADSPMVGEFIRKDFGCNEWIKDKS